MPDLITSTLSPFTASDGENLALRDWPLSATQRHATVLLVHGLGEHSGRYAQLAGYLNRMGLAVRGYDHYGHGESSGPRGGLTSDHRLLDDLADIVDATRARMQPQEPLLLLGHSMGGLVAAAFVAQNLRPVDGLVLSSPALATALNPVQRLLLATLPAVAPNLRVGNGLDADYLSHDKAVVAAYRADPLCHDRICARLARFIARTGPATVARARQWRVPTLLLWAGADHLVDPTGSHSFAQMAPANMVQGHCFTSLYHELFNEVDAKPVLVRLQAWLQEFLSTRSARPSVAV